MKIGLFSRYPPFEGGVASSAYWDSKHLGEKGIEINIISNPWDETGYDKEYIPNNELKKLRPKNVNTYFKNPLEQNRIVNSKGPGLETKLLSLGIEADRKERFDIIQGFYLFPYGMAAWNLSKFLNKPLITRTAGSDLYSLRTINLAGLIELFNQSDHIISRSDVSKKIFDKEKRISFKTAVPPEFNFDIKPKYKFDDPTIGIIGKYTDSKHIDELILALNNIEEDFKLLSLIDKHGQNEIKKIMDEETLNKTHFMQFTPPWNMPSLYKSMDILYCGEKNFVVEEHFPQIALEAFSCGVCTILSDELFNKYSSALDLNKNNVIKVDSRNPKEIKKKTRNLLKNKALIDDIGRNALKIPKFEYDNYISSLVDLYQKAI